jgi:hypothetical protein
MMVVMVVPMGMIVEAVVVRHAVSLARAARKSAP